LRVSFKAVLVVAVVLVVLYGFNFLYALKAGGRGGTFGDTFGTVNALFSGCALFFLVLAFISQREELKLVKEERDATRDILSSQEALNKTQQKALNQQIFEQSFNSIYSVFLERLYELNKSELPIRESALATIGQNCQKQLANLDERNSKLGTNSEIERAKPLVFIFFYLNNLLESNRSLGGQLSRYNKLLSSCINPHFASAICYYSIQELSRSTDSETYYAVARKFECDRMLSSEAKKAFDTAINASH